MPSFSASRAAALDEARLDVAERRQALLDGGPGRGGLGRAVADRLAAALVEHHRDDVLEAFAILAHEGGIGEGQEDQARARRARSSVPRRRARKPSATTSEGAERPGRRAAPAAASGAKDSVKCVMDCSLSWRSMGQPLEQVAHVDLVGLVVAGQGVHHEVDAAAQRQLALPVAARHQRVERLALGIGRPAGRKIVRRDDDRATRCRPSGPAG